MLLDSEVGNNREMGVIMGNVSVHSHSVPVYLLRTVQKLEAQLLYRSHF